MGDILEKGPRKSLSCLMAGREMTTEVFQGMEDVEGLLCEVPLCLEKGQLMMNIDNTPREKTKSSKNLDNSAVKLCHVCVRDRANTSSIAQPGQTDV